MAVNPRGEAADIDIELEAFRLRDEASALGLAALSGVGLLSAAPVAPSPVQLVDPGFPIGAAKAAVLGERGFEVRTVRGAGRTIHRDGFDAFMASLDGWIRQMRGYGPDRFRGSGPYPYALTYLCRLSRPPAPARDPGPRSPAPTRRYG
ncbi:hypothetical protein [Streptomyces enissocaesilis]|uniref:Uncharacterized protein n=1 Tax=Streptomyces enissocaesilis TaxID=332589 RepID=A0ABP6K166_9ACTN